MTKLYSKILLIIVIAFVAGFLLNLAPVFAQDAVQKCTGTGWECALENLKTFNNKTGLPNPENPTDQIIGIVNFLLGLVGVIFIILIIYGGFMYMLSGGETEKITKAKGIIKAAIIGIIIIALAAVIANFVVSFLVSSGGGAESL